MHTCIPTHTKTIKAPTQIRPQALNRKTTTANIALAASSGIWQLLGATVKCTMHRCTDSVDGASSDINTSDAASTTQNKKPCDMAYRKTQTVPITTKRTRTLTLHHVACTAHYRAAQFSAICGMSRAATDVMHQLTAADSQ